MPFWLRKIRKGRWYKNANVPWLQDEALQADALTDLKTDSNSLSMWYIESDRSNLGRVLSALAAKCDQISNFDYALISEDLVKELDIRIVNIAGETPDSQANALWHRDFAELTSEKLFKLSKAIQRGEINRLNANKVEQSLRNSMEQGFLKLDDINETLRTKITNGKKTG